MKPNADRKKSWIFIVLALAGSLAASSCAELMQRLALVNCKYSFHDIAPVNIGLTSLDLRLGIKIDNPNSVNVILDSLGFDFFINENRIFQGTASNRLEIPTGTSSILEQVISISYFEAGAAIIKAIKDNRADYRLTGTAHYDTPIGRLAFPVDIVRGQIK